VDPEILYQGMNLHPKILRGEFFAERNEFFVMKILSFVNNAQHNPEIEFAKQNFHCSGAKSLTSCGFF
jgi:hypothetical protein